MFEYNCIIKRVVDGDTIDIDIDLGFDCWLHNQRVRVMGINAPETRTRDLDEKAEGFRVKKFVEEAFPVGSQQKFICGEYNVRGKYGRILGTFAMYDVKKDTWSDLSTVLLENGMAEKYS